MQNDESIWTCIGTSGFCSFKVKVKTPPQVFCRSEYNVSGICSRVTCPLANSQYATVIEKEGVCYLYKKTVERAHSPRNMWEKIILSRNYAEALRQIDTNLEYWPSHMVHRAKQRLTRIRQTLIRMRKLALRDNQTELVPIKQKTVRRESQREKKAEVAANVEKALSEELLDRLKKGTYSIYNYPNELFNKAVEEVGEEEEEELEEEDFDNDEEEDEIVKSGLSNKGKKRREIEYEMEMEEEDEDHHLLDI